jgi:hypothetical protein
MVIGIGGSGPRVSAAAAMLLLLGMPACSGTTSPGSQVEVAASRWEERGPPRYNYIFHQSCECLFTGTYSVTVHDGVVIFAMPVPVATPPAPSPDLEAMPTIDDLFDRLRTAAAANPIRFEVEYDEEFGYPTSGSFDISAVGADDEYAFEARELKIDMPHP